MVFKLIQTIISVLLLTISTSSLSQAQLKEMPQPVARERTVVQHPWVVPSPNMTSEAYFTNLVDGAKIETPFRATFGLGGGWGLAPITSPANGKSGHHHLLVNRDLPLDFGKALPFNDQYIHFGKGQMETVLTLEPGSYTLRLLLADDKHIPRFVYSKPLKIVVTRKNKDIAPKSLIANTVSLLNIFPDGKLKPPFRVQFHSSGLNVAHLSQKEKDTGHFRLTLTSSKGSKSEVLDFINGQTETWLAPPPGPYSMKLDFVDNNMSDKTMASTANVPIRVE
jgi:Domain of unknown function (DUF4399)